MGSYSSTMKPSDVKTLTHKYKIPRDLHPVAVSSEWTMDRLDDDCIGLYEQYFEFAGLRGHSDAMCWRHHDSDISDPALKDGFDETDVVTLTHQPIDIRGCSTCVVANRLGWVVLTSASFCSDLGNPSEKPSDHSGGVSEKPGGASLPKKDSALVYQKGFRSDRLSEMRSFGTNLLLPKGREDDAVKSSFPLCGGDKRSPTEPRK
ncbi:hypothetical protein Tco_0809626 [Tanacetum coccineum]